MAAKQRPLEMEIQKLDELVIGPESMETLQKMGRYNANNPNIKEGNFLSSMAPIQSEKPCLIRFNRRVQSKEVVAFLEKSCYRLATGKELLALGVRLIGRNFNNLLVALGDSAVLDRRRWVVCLALQPMWRECGLRRLTTPWSDRTQFLVFEKSEVRR